MHESIDLCPECVARTKAILDELKTQTVADAAAGE